MRYIEKTIASLDYDPRTHLLLGRVGFMQVQGAQEIYSEYEPTFDCLFKNVVQSGFMGPTFKFLSLLCFTLRCRN